MDEESGTSITLIGMNASGIRMLVDHALPTHAWCETVREHAHYIIQLTDDIQASLAPRTAAEVN